MDGQITKWTLTELSPQLVHYSAINTVPEVFRNSYNPTVIRPAIPVTSEEQDTQITSSPFLTMAHHGSPWLPHRKQQRPRGVRNTAAARDSQLDPVEATE